MEPDFWHQRWKDNNIGFHEPEANSSLTKYVSKLSLAKGCRVFVPLCGKTHDIAWLLSRGYRIAGVELSALAVTQLFEELGVEPSISDAGNLKRYKAKNIDIFVGDFFELTKMILSPVDAVYDRAALVALPENMRDRYTSHLTEITDIAPQLLVCFVYDQNLLAGPPFSISDDEVNRHYNTRYALTRLANTDIPGGFQGKCPAETHVWLLESR